MPADGPRKRPSGRSRMAARGDSQPTPDASTAPQSVGPVEEATRAQLAEMTVPPSRQALAAVALNLARTLDNGAGMAAAAVARELRLTMDALGREADGADDDVTALLRELSAAVQHP